MKKIVCALLLGLSLNSSWAQEIQQEDSALPHSIEPMESNPRKFADLARTTMDLMRPELETTQTLEQETNNLPIVAN